LARIRSNRATRDTVEQRLQSVRTRLCWLAEIFESRALTPDYVRSEQLGTDASLAAAEFCECAAADVRAVLQVLSTDGLNLPMIRQS